MVADNQVRAGVGDALQGLNQIGRRKRNVLYPAVANNDHHVHLRPDRSDQFDDIDLEQSPVLQYLNNLSMSLRRVVFLVLVGQEYKTLDNMKAFALSANLVVNRKDMDKFTAILKQALSDHQRFYKVFMDTLAEVGKI